MVVIAGIGPFTTLMEMVATSIGVGAVVGGFVAAGAGMLNGRSRSEMEANALREGFVGGLGGMSCLCLDLILEYAL